VQKLVHFQILTAFIRIDFKTDSQRYTNCCYFFAIA